MKLEDGTVVDTDEGVRRGSTVEALAKLNGILHPLIWDWMDDQDAIARKAATGDLIIVVDNPLLIEMHRTHTVELIIVVDIPVEAQVERMVSARGMTREAMVKLADWITRVVEAPADEAVLAKVAHEVKELCAHYPAPGIRI